MTDRPLEGLLVIAIEQAVAAPLCTARLVDAGARVIKVERAGGDFARGYDRAAKGDSSYFAWTNHGKESIVLDFKQADDAALLHRLIAAADVLVQNLAPGALDRAGFGTASLRDAHPALVVCEITGYGDAPALMGKKAYDLLVQAESGLIAVSGAPGSPGRIGVSICDIGTGLAAYTGVLEALIGRSLHGRGATLAVSLFDVAAEWMSVPYAQHVHGDGGPDRVGLRHPTIAPYGAFETADGALTLISVQNEREWRRLCTDVLERASLADEPRFAGNTERVRHRDALEALMASLVGELSRDTFRARLTAADIAFGAVSSLDDLVAHAALRRRPIVSSEGAMLDLPAHPVRHAESDDRARADGASSGRVPRLGEHGDRIRAEFPA